MRVNGPFHPSTLGSRKNLAICLHQQQRFDESQFELEAVISVMEHVEGPDHPDTLSAVEELADVFESMGRVAEADAAWNRVLAGHLHAARNDELERVRGRQQSAAERRTAPRQSTAASDGVATPVSMPPAAAPSESAERGAAAK
jgi:hypothetical protein